MTDLIRLLRPLALILALPAAASDTPIAVEDAYAFASRPGAPTGAAYLVLENTGEEDDRLLSVASEAAARVEIHTHVIDTNGVARMIAVEDGIALPAGASHALARGGDHIMFMGLTEPFVQGATVAVTLTFEKAGDITIDIPVDLERTDGGIAHGTKSH